MKDRVRSQDFQIYVNITIQGKSVETQFDLSRNTHHRKRVPKQI